MKKDSKMILLIFIILIVSLGVMYYLLIPQEKIEKSSNKIISIEEILKKISIDNISEIELIKNPIKLKGTISISDDEFENIIYTIMNKYNSKDSEYIDINIDNKKIKITYPYKILNFIESKLEVNLHTSIVNNDINIIFNNVKLGKINISNKMIEKELNKYKEIIPFKIEKNIIKIDKDYIYPATINNIEIGEKDIIINLEVQANNFVDFISKYKIKINQ
ncbi:MAG: hypothetical protein RSD47_01445 [Romboutsia sp.]